MIRNLISLYFLVNVSIADMHHRYTAIKRSEIWLVFKENVLKSEARL